MDVLTDALRMMRIGQAHAARVDHAPPFGRRFPSFTGIGFHIGVQGSCWVVPDAGEPLHVAPGDVVLLPSGRAHAVLDSLTTPVADAPTALSNLTEVTEPETAAPAEQGSTVLLCGAYLLRRTHAHPMFEDLPVAIHLTREIGMRNPIGALGDLLAEELEHRAPGADAARAGLLDVLLVAILRTWLHNQAGRTERGWAAALNDRATASALRLIHESPARQWTVERLAAKVGMSRAGFSRRFSSLVGQPPMTYLTWWRLTLAAEALQDPGTPLAVIARRVGYGSEFALAHAFKRVHGLAPGEYRRRMGEEPAGMSASAEPT